MEQFSHTDEAGRARMVDVSAKPAVKRTARAIGRIEVMASTLNLIRENLVKKGDVLTTAEIAGIQAAKETSRLIPLCHPLGLTHVAVEARLTESGVEVVATTGCTGPTGVEMEALTAVSVALLTIYDMCKAVDKTMRIQDIRLLEKTKEAL